MSDAPVTLVSPDGQRFDVPPSGVETLRRKGFRDLNDGERKDLELQKKYGEGVLPPLGAAASGAASALTFGASDVALAKTPLAEANRELVARNPQAHTVGQVAAIAAPLVGELAGASTAGKVAQAAGGAITGVGKAAAGVGKAASAAAEGVGLGKIAPIVGGAVQGAAEGAAFQVGSNIGAAARRDVPMDAETLLSHAGEAAILGGAFGASIPAAGKVARWSAEKATAGLERGMQGLRKLGFGAADVGLDAVEAAIPAADRGLQTVANHADTIGEAVEGAGQKIANAADEHLLPRIRKGLSEQTGRPDVINEVFAPGEEARALRKELGPQTLTGTRETHAEELSKSLNEIWKQSLDNAPMFDDLALASKRDLQASELAASPMTRQAQSAVVKQVIDRANETLGQLGKFNKDAETIFNDALKDFARTALKNPSGEALYRGLDGLKTATDKIAQFAKGATGDMSIGAGAAADAARDFRSFAKTTLEDTNVWGAAGQIQQEVNAAYSRYRRAFDQFEKQFAAAKAKGQPARLLDGAKITKWSRDITGPNGQIRNAVIDDLVQAQTDLIGLTERLSKQVQTRAVETLGSSTANTAQRARAEAVTSAPELVPNVLGQSSAAIGNVAKTKAAATKAIDRAEVLQQTQSAILSRQGAGVNPLPVELAQRIGGGAIVGGMVGGVPGAVIGGGITSVLQKYGAITTNPKTAIEFLNSIDRLRGIDKERVASWLKATIGETEKAGARGALTKLKEKIPAAREAVASANQTTARKILEARGAAERGIEALATRAGAATPGIMRRVLPAVSYADVTNSSPEEWWKRTQKTLVAAQANPQALIDKLSTDVKAISDALPDMAEAISKQQLAVVGYLADRMPRNPRPYMLGQGEWTPDRGEMKAFRDLVLVATKPDALLPLITLGTATRAQVDAVKELWPRKFEETRQQVVSMVMTAAAEGKPVSYQARLRLGQLLGTPLDASQEPGFYQWIQQGVAPPPQEQQPPAPTISGNLNLNPDENLPASAKAAERK